MKDLSKLLAKINHRATSSVIRDLFKYTSKPGLISFAGGMPDPSFFPAQDIIDITKELLTKNKNQALQYGYTEGEPVFKQELKKLLKQDENLIVTDDELMITSASQQGLDIAGRTFIDEGDTIIVSKPTYLGALQAFKAYGANMVGVESDEDGMLDTDLEKKLAQIKAEGKICKFIYLVPDFQNPSGLTIPAQRRKKILEIAKKYQTLILEDSPYRKIRFEGEHQPTFYSLDKGEGNVITMFTFSKTFVPGFRLGYIIGSKEIIKRFSVQKQAIDLCTSAFSQLVTAGFLGKGLVGPHVQKVVKVYAQKRDAMVKALEKYMPEGVKWTYPHGGLFLWVILPEHMDTVKMFPSAIENNVAYVVGNAFFHDGSGHNTMRLNFSYASFDEIDKGIKRLADTIKNYKA